MKLGRCLTMSNSSTSSRTNPYGPPTSNSATSVALAAATRSRSGGGASRSGSNHTTSAGTNRRRPVQASSSSEEVRPQQRRRIDPPATSNRPSNASSTAAGGRRPSTATTAASGSPISLGGTTDVQMPPLPGTTTIPVAATAQPAADGGASTGTVDEELLTPSKSAPWSDTVTFRDIFARYSSDELKGCVYLQAYKGRDAAPVNLLCMAVGHMQDRDEEDDEDNGGDDEQVPEPIFDTTAENKLLKSATGSRNNRQIWTHMRNVFPWSNADAMRKEAMRRAKVRGDAKEPAIKTIGKAKLFDILKSSPIEEEKIIIMAKLEKLEEYVETYGLSNGNDDEARRNREMRKIMCICDTSLRDAFYRRGDVHNRQEIDGRNSELRQEKDYYEKVADMFNNPDLTLESTVIPELGRFWNEPQKLVPVSEGYRIQGKDVKNFLGNVRYAISQLKANHGVSGTGNSTLNQNRRGSDDESDAPENGGVEADRQAGLIGGSIVYDEDDRLQFVKNSIYAEIYAYHWGKCGCRRDANNRWRWRTNLDCHPC